MDDTQKKHHQSAQLMAWSFVGIQFVLIALIVFLPRDTQYQAGTLAVGIGYFFMAIGAALGLWSAFHLGRGLTPSPLPNGAIELVTKGPYRYMRHPMYSSVMIFCVGVALRAGSIAVWAAFVGLVILFSVKSRWEERHLSATFSGYSAYQDSTARFFPGVPGTSR